MREDAVLIPGGHDVIIGGDRLFILSLTESIPAVEQMLSQGREQI
jgi:trk system potassium uptake protein TrkA